MSDGTIQSYQLFVVAIENGLHLPINQSHLFTEQVCHSHVAHEGAHDSANVATQHHLSEGRYTIIFECFFLCCSRNEMNESTEEQRERE